MENKNVKYLRQGCTGFSSFSANPSVGRKKPQRSTAKARRAFERASVQPVAARPHEAKNVAVKKEVRFSASWGGAQKKS